VIITRTPLRITLGGGGTDLPSYYEKRGGAVLSAAINKYVYIAVNQTFTEDYFIKYSELERTEGVDEIQHPIIREALKMHPVGPAIELVSLADIPAGTGLGSSGAFTVGLLRTLYSLKREHVAAGSLAEEACHIEIDRLNRSVGKQDQYIAAFGGLTNFRIETDGRVHVEPLLIAQETMLDLEERLLLFFTGYARDAESMLEDQKKRSEEGEEGMLANLDTVARIGEDTKAALEAGDTNRFGELMHEHWENKRKRSKGMSSDAVDRWYEAGRNAGAVGGKLVGAGAGGFLLFYADDQAAIREAMAKEGLREVRFSFDHDGSRLIVRD
jgi:D-glycero-alpha-D-manno-heptose-7-phosphate kinase